VGAALINQYPELVPGEQLMDLDLYDVDEEVGLPNMADAFVDIEDAIDPGSIDGGGDGAPAIDWTDDGLNPNATGAEVFTTTAQTAISALAQVLAQEKAEGSHMTLRQRNQGIQAITKAKGEGLSTPNL
jgi:hypothetical protein